MISSLNKKNIEYVLKKNKDYVIQFHDGIYFATNEQCLWIGHYGEFFEMETEKYDENGIEHTNLNDLSNCLIINFLDKYDYCKASKAEKCEFTNSLWNKTIGVISLSDDKNKQVYINEKYYNTFKKGCNFLIYKSSFPVFVADKEGLLIGIIASMYSDDYQIKK